MGGGMNALLYITLGAALLVGVIVMMGAMAERRLEEDSAAAGTDFHLNGHDPLRSRARAARGHEAESSSDGCSVCVDSFANEAPAPNRKFASSRPICQTECANVSKRLRRSRARRSQNKLRAARFAGFLAYRKE
jgi:hypothetical protein